MHDKMRTPEKDLTSSIAVSESTSGFFSKAAANTVEAKRVTAKKRADCDQDHCQRLEQTVVRLNQQLIETDVQLAASKRDHRLEVSKLARKFQNLIESLPGGVIQLDSKGCIKASNTAANTLLDNLAQGEPWVDVIERSFSPRLDDGHEISLKSGLRVSLATCSYDEEPGQLLLLTDQTETRLLQNKLHHHERLSTMGKMMAGLAHQIRTPLASATLYAAHLQDSVLDDVKAKRFAGKISTQLKAIEEQIRDMLVFARRDIRITNKVNVKQLMAKLEESMQATIAAAGASYELDVADGGVELHCNLEVLKGALLNLVENAVQAADNATLYIRADCSKGDVVTILVQDFGCGFDISAIEGKNAAFASSKPQGTGLGLSVVRAVVNAHHGQFSIRSAPKFGTSVIITLPLLHSSEHSAQGLSQMNREGSQSLLQGAAIREESAG